VPKPFVDRDQAFLVAPIRGSRLMSPTDDSPRQHGRQLFRRFKIALIASLVECGADVGRLRAGLTACLVGRRVGGRIIIDWRSLGDSI